MSPLNLRDYYDFIELCGRPGTSFYPVSFLTRFIWVVVSYFKSFVYSMYLYLALYRVCVFWDMFINGSILSCITVFSVFSSHSELLSLLLSRWEPGWPFPIMYAWVHHWAPKSIGRKKLANFHHLDLHYCGTRGVSDGHIAFNIGSRH